MSRILDACGVLGVGVAVSLGGAAAFGVISTDEVRAKKFVLEGPGGEDACVIHLHESRVAIDLVSTKIRLITVENGLALQRLDGKGNAWMKLEVAPQGALMMLSSGEQLTAVSSLADGGGGGLQVTGDLDGGSSLWVGYQDGSAGLRALSATGEEVVVAAEEEAAEVLVGKKGRRVGMHSSEDYASVAVQHGVGLATVRARDSWKGSEIVVSGSGEDAGFTRIAANQDGGTLLVRSGPDRAVEATADSDHASIRLLDKFGRSMQSRAASDGTTFSMKGRDGADGVEIVVRDTGVVEARGIDG